MKVKYSQHACITNSISFDFPHFTPNDSHIQFQNDTFWEKNNAIELTKDIDSTPNRLESVGWATYSETIQLWDAATGSLTDFDTHFSFIIGSIEAKGNGDGITFFLAPFGSKVPPRSSVGSLALFVSERADDPRKNRVVAVEFDTFQNAWDPSPDHVGINVNSIVSVANVSWNSSMKDGRTANAQVLPQRIMVGFSGSAGWTAETQRILSWQFSSTLEINEGKTNKENLSDIYRGNGSKDDERRSGSKIGLNFDDDKENSNMDNEFEKGTGPKKFSYSDLVYATNNFDESRKIGEGGSGGVYKGFLSNLSLNVAVKRVSRGSKQGIKEYHQKYRLLAS
ncbi:hypothetical protein C5167_026480 [Papaver somniferum]|nr:hypothetical protein C5167_026480 [Papaver somniferum]